MAEGDKYFEQQKFREARLKYAGALQLDPRFPDAQHKIAKCELKLANWTSAYQDLQRAVALDPKNWPTHLDLGQLYLAAGRASEAKDEALLILKANPVYVDAEILLSDADVQLGNLMEALREASEAVNAAPQNATAYVNLAGIQQRSGFMNEAEATLVKAEALSPPLDSSPVMALGTLYKSEKRWREAELQFRKAADVIPESPAPRAELAALFLAEGRRDLAEEMLVETKKHFVRDPAGYTLLASYYLSEGDTHKATEELTSLRKDHPENIDVGRSLVRLLILTDQSDWAAKVAEELLKEAPRDPETLILKGEILLHDKKPDTALAVLQEAVMGAPTNPTGHYDLGVAHLHKGNTREAEKEWQDAVELRPGYIDAWVALGNSAARHGNWAELERIGMQLRKVTPRSPEALLFVAAALANRGETSQAEAALDELIHAAPKDSRGYTKLGQLRASQRRWSEAQTLYREALSYAPDNLEAIEGSVDLDIRWGKAAEARQFVEDQIRSSPGIAPLYVLRAQLQLQDKRPTDAEASLAQCLEQDARNRAALVLLAQVDQQLGKIAEAITNYQRAIALQPEDVDLQIRLGETLETQGNWEGAQKAYQQALSIHPEDAVAANNLAYLMLEHAGNVTVALTLAQTARRGLPTAANSADTLGWAYFQNGAYEMAARQLEEAVKGAPSNATYHYHLGVICEQLKDPKRARSELRKSIDLDPSAPIAEKASRALLNL